MTSSLPPLSPPAPVNTDMANAIRRCQWTLYRQQIQDTPARRWDLQMLLLYYLRGI